MITFFTSWRIHIFQGSIHWLGEKISCTQKWKKLDSSQKKPGSLQGYRARCVLSAFMWRCYYWNAHYVPAGHQGYLLTANFDSEVKCCKFWTQSQHRSLPLTAIPRWSADIKGRRLWQRLRYILVCWDYLYEEQADKRNNRYTAALISSRLQIYL